MTGVAICRCALIDAIDMARGALNIFMFSSKRESGQPVVEIDIRPFCRLMTGSTICAKLTVMIILRCVTGITIFRRAFIYIIHVTGRAGDTLMRACQRETCIAVVEGHVLPTGCIMTVGAYRSELPVVRIFCGMAGNTIFWRACKNSIDVAGCTLDIGVPTR